MAQAQQPGHVNKAAAPFYRVHKPEHAIQQRPVLRRTFPLDQLARQNFQRFAGFRDKFVE